MWLSVDSASFLTGAIQSEAGGRDARPPAARMGAFYPDIEAASSTWQLRDSPDVTRL
jgi:hypothetical protein